MTERERFEAWAQSEGFTTVQHGDGYGSIFTQNAWKTWQAARVDLARVTADLDRAERVVAFLSESYDVCQIPDFYSDAELIDWSDEQWQPYLAAVRATRGEAD